MRVAFQRSKYRRKLLASLMLFRSILSLTLRFRLAYASNVIDTWECDRPRKGIARAIHSSEGNVRWRLLSSDDIYAELALGQHITLVFTLPNSLSEERTFIFYTEGYYHTIT